MYYIINGKIVETTDFYEFKGNNIGFIIFSTTAKNKQITFDRLIVKQDIVDENPVKSNLVISDWKGNGSGFFIGAKGYIATNYHVIENASEIEVDFILKGENKKLKATVITVDKLNDLAILKIDNNSIIDGMKIPYNLNTQISDVASSVFTLGFPMALSVMGEEVKFTDGKISAKTGFQGDITTYQTSVPIQPGNSGGPLFDFEGNIIGVTNAKIRNTDNVTYAIKATYLKNLIDVLPEKIENQVNTISSKSLTEKIKTLTDYVVLIKVR